MDSCECVAEEGYWKLAEWGEDWTSGLLSEKRWQWQADKSQRRLQVVLGTQPICRHCFLKYVTWCACIYCIFLCLWCSGRLTAHSRGIKWRSIYMFIAALCCLSSGRCVYPVCVMLNYCLEQYCTSNITGRHRRPKWKLQAGYRAPSL